MNACSSPSHSPNIQSEILRLDHRCGRSYNTKVLAVFVCLANYINPLDVECLPPGVKAPHSSIERFGVWSDDVLCNLGFECLWRRGKDLQVSATIPVLDRPCDEEVDSHQHQSSIRLDINIILSFSMSPQTSAQDSLGAQLSKPSSPSATYYSRQKLQAKNKCRSPVVRSQILFFSYEQRGCRDSLP